jgi:hypothetical protein
VKNFFMVAEQVRERKFSDPILLYQSKQDGKPPGLKGLPGRILGRTNYDFIAEPVLFF